MCVVSVAIPLRLKIIHRNIVQMSATGFVRIGVPENIIITIKMDRRISALLNKLTHSLIFLRHFLL